MSGVSGTSAVTCSDRIRAERTLKEEKKLLVQQAFWTEAAAMARKRG